MGRLSNCLSSFKNHNILILGDMIADEFIIGQPERLSREAPVLILQQTGHEILPGGGTNAANNVATLGGQVYLAGVIGNDNVGQRLTAQLKNTGMNTEGLIIDSSRPTSVKTRILAGGGQTVKQQMVRVDNLKKDPINKEIEDQLIEYVSRIADEIDAVILSDYGNGVFTDRVREKTIEIFNQHNKIIAVDSRYDLKKFKNITIATPNKEEAEKALGFTLDSTTNIEKAGWRLKDELKAESLLVTLGGDGMQIFTDTSCHIPASNYTEVFDVTGAGDTVIATLTLALASGASMVEAMKLSNYAAGIVVKKSGVATLNIEELANVIGEE